MLRKTIIIATSLFLLAGLVWAGFFLVQKRATDKIVVEDVGYGKIPNKVAQINDEERFSFAVLGDTQRFKVGNEGGFQMAAANLEKMDPDLIFALGDLVANCRKTDDCEKDYVSWRNVLGSLSAKTYPAQGNHDRTGREKADAAWEKIFDDLPANGLEGFSKFVYSFDYGNSHFVVLASDNPKEHRVNDIQRGWLEDDLAKNKKKNVFVFFHEPAYPVSSKVGESLDAEKDERDALWSILEKYKVTAVFSGHEHIQSRRKAGTLYQFGFGNTDSYNHDAPEPGITEYFHVGKAFGLVEVDRNDIVIKTYSVEGELLDSFALPKN